MTMILHAIQLTSVEVEDLTIQVLDRYKFKDGNYEKDFSYTIYYTEFDKEESRIRVKVELKIEPKDDTIDRPFKLRVGVAGDFVVDQQRFPAELIDQFVKGNAPIILLPYVREHAFSLTQRAGFDAIILPLVEVPTIRLAKTDQT